MSGWLWTDATSWTPRETDWLWEDWVPREAVTLLNADTGLGKTTVCCDLVSRWSRGVALPDGSRTPAVRVLYVCLDDVVAKVTARIAAAGGAPKGAVLMFGAPDATSDSIVFPRDRVDLVEAIRRVDAGAVVIDTLVRAVDETKDMKDYQAASEVLGSLDAVARETGAGVLVVNHVTKGTGGPKVDSGYGSKGGVSGVARSVLTLTREAAGGEGRYVLEVVKSNYGEPVAPVPYRIESTYVPGEDRFGKRVDVKTSRIEWLVGETVQTVGRGRAARNQSFDDGDDAVLRLLLEDGPVEVAVLRRKLDAMSWTPARIDRGWQRVLRSVRMVGDPKKWVAVLKDGEASEGATSRVEADPDELGPIPDVSANGRHVGALAGWTS